MIESRGIVRQAIARSGVRRSVDDVLHATKTTRPRAANLIEVSVTDRRAKTARAVANAIADVFVEQINDLQPAASSEPLVSNYERARKTS
jgi:capsular polysaccharide biosynthesis protein